jgi:alkyl hydroperoxide reductase subunit AhpF
MSADENVTPCEIERAARAWEAKGREIMRNMPRNVPGDSRWREREVTYCFARAAGLFEALDILAREEEERQ